MSAGDRTFGYARGVAPPLWVLFAIGLVELFVAHLLLSHWWPRVATLVGLVTAASLVWLAWTIRSFARLPVIVASDRIVLRTGWLKRVTIAPAQVAAVVRHWPGEAVRDRATLNLAMVAYPNVMVQLRDPIVWRGRSVDAIAHKLDDPDGFARAVDEVALGARA